MEAIVLNELGAVIEIAESETAQNYEYLIDDVDEMSVDVDERRLCGVRGRLLVMMMMMMVTVATVIVAVGGRRGRGCRCCRHVEKMRILIDNRHEMI